MKGEVIKDGDKHQSENVLESDITGISKRGGEVAKEVLLLASGRLLKLRYGAAGLFDKQRLWGRMYWY
ncbi:hypothetical protein V6N12_023975 [Hibiscus sabdariffa]|uniref:Uncharacterized protein n=1 Tax=Hibiscus sabdariffa TaxID=183260 RepID=A0ABR2FZ84_9ROSI